MKMPSRRRRFETKLVTYAIALTGLWGAAEAAPYPRVLKCSGALPITFVYDRSYGSQGQNKVTFDFSEEPNLSYFKPLEFTVFAEQSTRERIEVVYEHRLDRQTVLMVRVVRSPSQFISFSIAKFRYGFDSYEKLGTSECKMFPA